MVSNFKFQWPVSETQVTNLRSSSLTFIGKSGKNFCPKLCQLERQEKRLRLFWPIRALFEPVSALAALLVVHFLLVRVISGDAPPYGITLTQQLNICRNRSFDFHLHLLQFAMIGFYIIESICIQWHLTNQDKQPQMWIDHIRDILEWVNIINEIFARRSDWGYHWAADSSLF